MSVVIANSLPKPPTEEEMSSMNDTDRRELLRECVRQVVLHFGIHH